MYCYTEITALDPERLQEHIETLGHHTAPGQGQQQQASQGLQHGSRAPDSGPAASAGAAVCAAEQPLDTLVTGAHQEAQRFVSQHIKRIKAQATGPDGKLQCSPEAPCLAGLSDVHH